MTHVTLTFDAQVELAAAAGKTDADAGRSVAGLIVPYNVEAEVWPMGRLEFAPGSIELAGRVPMLLGHDMNRPVGVLAQKIDSESGLYATFRIDDTPDGSAALSQATSGSRAGLSVGADILESESLEGGELTRVTLAKVGEVSLVSLAAFDSAAVDAVAAAKSIGKEADMETEEVKAAARAAERETDADDQADVEAARRPVVLAERPQPRMRLGEYVANYIAAQKGDSGARARIEAALTREVVGNEPGVIPIAYSGELIDGLGADRPLHDAFATAQMPPAGMTIRRPIWTTRPDGNWLADDTAGAPSGPVVIGNKDVAIVQWAWGGSCSVALAERSSPGYVEEIMQEAVRGYYRDTEAAIAAALTTVAAGAATSLGDAVAGYMTATRTSPNLIVCGAAAYGKVIDSLGPLRYSSGSADASGNANLAGLNVVASPDVVSADAWVTHTQYLETRESSPLRLSVGDVTSLSLEVGVTSFWALTDHLIPGGAVRLAGFTPPATQSATPQKGGK